MIPLGLTLVPVVWWRLSNMLLCRAVYVLFPHTRLKRRTDQYVKNSWLLAMQVFTGGAVCVVLSQQPDRLPLLWLLVASLLAFLAYYLGYEAVLLGEIAKALRCLDAGVTPEMANGTSDEDSRLQEATEQ
jgi:hypothetical protein